MDALGALVDMGDDQGLSMWIELSEAANEKVPRCGEPVKLQREFGTLIPQPQSLPEPADRAHFN